MKDKSRTGYMRAWRQKNKERLREYEITYRLKNLKRIQARKKVYDQAYREKHRERISKYARIYRQKNVKRIQNRVKAYYIAHREERRAYARRRIAARKKIRFGKA